MLGLWALLLAWVGVGASPWEVLGGLSGSELVGRLADLATAELQDTSGLEATEADGLLSQCSQDLVFLAITLKDIPKSNHSDLIHNWAVQVMDSFGRPHAGITKGNLLWVGDMDTCQKVHSGPGSVNLSIPLIPHLPPLRVRIKGDYVGHYVKLLLHLPQAAFLVMPGAPYFGSLQWGLCLPASCNATELDDSIRKVFEDVPALRRSGVKYQGIQEPSGSPRLSGRGKAAVAVLGVFGALAVLGTVLRLLTSIRARRGREWDDLKHGCSGGFCGALRSFGVQSHWERVFGAREESRDLRAMDGLRVLTAAWLVLGHSYFFALPVASNPLEIADPASHGFFFQIVLQTPYVVDTFYLLSGTLVSYNFLRKMRAHPERIKSGLFWLGFYGHRFVRILQPYMLIMTAYVGLNKFFGTGPLWPENGFEIEECAKTFWTNLLFINNVYPVHFNGTDGNLHRQYCGVWTWYLGNEMQYFVLSPLFLIPLGLGLRSADDAAPAGSRWIARRGWTTWGLGGLAATSAAALIGVGVVSFNEGFPPNPFPPDTTHTALIEKMTNAGYGPGGHLVCYLVGIFLGWCLLQNTDGIRTQIHRVVGTIGWVSSISMCMAIVFGIWPEYRGHPFSTRLAAFYSSGSRLGWALGVGWIVYACARKRGGLVGRVLEWRCWLPLSRLSFVFYLVHPIIMLSFFHSRSQPIHMDDWIMTQLFGGFLVEGFIAAFFVSMIFESPILVMSNKFRRFMNPV